ncbi:probable chitinase 2 isoform X2 [Anabrus simplex]|uniref:probable chitinase 2 isoform X2 n=2 Tax=Anabrus simplex TaxID=316456 RepID=UPI0035A3BA1A
MLTPVSCILLSRFWILLLKYTQWTTMEKKPPHDRVVVCYVASWARYRTGRGAFTLDDIDPSLCTHLVYAFAGLNINTNSIRSLDEYNDLEENYGLGSFRKITALKNTFPHLKVTLAIGGWNEGSANYSLMASTPTRRQQFIKSVVTMLKEYNFDGLDLDWEYPGMREGKPEDKENFVHLVKELREEFDKHNWILTAALGAAKSTIDTAYDVPALSRYLDLMHIMCYDYHGTWDKKTGPNAPLYGTDPSDTLSVEFSIKYFLKLGAPRNKLVMGLPLYGRTFFSDGPSNVRGLGVPAEEKGFQGQFTKEDGYMGYNEICIELTNKTSPFEKYWDEKSATPYAIQGNKIIVYDDARSLTLKVKHAMQNDLAGVMVWPMDTDDFHGDCTAMIEGNDVKYPNYPLLRTINKAVVDALQDIQNEILTKQEKEKEREKAKSTDSKGTGAGLMASTTLCMLSSTFALMLRK